MVPKFQLTVLDEENNTYINLGSEFQATEKSISKCYKLER